MANTPQGNAIAYQAVKPVEAVKVGDLYSNLIDNMIKNQNAQKAAELKRAQDDQKYIGERFDKIQINPFATVDNLTDMAGGFFKQTFDYVSEQQRLAREDPSNSNKYLSRAQKAQSDYLQLASSLGSKDFIDRANAKAKALASEEYFHDSDDMDQYKMVSKAMFDSKINPETGARNFYVPQNRYAQDGDAPPTLSAGEFMNLFTKEPEKNTLPEFRKLIKDQASVFADSWSKNTNGNNTKEWKGFSEARGSEWFNTTYGEYNANYVPTELQQWSKDVLKKEIKNEEDYNSAKKSIVDNLSSFVPSVNTTDTKYMDIDIAQKNATLQKTRAQIKKLQEVKTQEFAMPAVQPSNIRLYDSKGQYIGRTESPTATVNIPGTQNFLSAKPYVSKDGKTTYNKYFVGGFAPDGTIIHNEVKNPISVLSAGKSKDNVKIIADLNRLSAGITPVSNANPIKIIKDKKDDMYRKTNINLKAKVTQDNYKKDVENSIYGLMVEE